MDAVRGGAALAVAVPHLMMVLRPENVLFEQISIVAVEIFFLLSGYVLAPQILYVSQGGTGKHGILRLKTFLVRRWMRTLPPYLFAVIAMAVTHRALFSEEFFKLLFFVQNFFVIDQQAEFFAPAWSLSVEEWFYVAFPAYLLGMRAAGMQMRQAILIYLGTFFVLKIAGLYFHPQWAESSRRLVIFRLDSICFGFLLYLAVEWLKEQEHQKAWLVASVLVLVVSSVVLFGLMSDLYSESNDFGRLAFMYIAPIFGASLLFCALKTEPVFRATKSMAWIAQMVGGSSYAIYIYHVLLIDVLIIMAGNEVHNAGYLIAIYVLMLVTLSYMFHLYVEQPILAARPRYETRADLQPSLELWRPESVEQDALNSETRKK